MVRRTAIPAALAAAALLASAACSNGGADKGSAGANPTLATDPPRTNPTLATVPAATTTTNPYAVPAVIDVAYVNRVLAGLDAVIGDVVRMVYSAKSIPPEALDRMRAVFLDSDRLQREIDGFQRDIRNGFAGYRPSPGNRVTAASRLISARSMCIFAEVSRDYSAVGTNTLPNVGSQWVALTPLEPSRDPHAYNPTRWAFVYDGFPSDRSQPSNPCANS